MIGRELGSMCASIRYGVNGHGDGGELDYVWPATYIHGEFEWMDGWSSSCMLVHAWSTRGGCARCMD
jgi:hypothetical protein